MGKIGRSVDCTGLIVAPGFIDTPFVASAMSDPVRRAQVVAVAPEARAFGDRQLLSQAVANLIDNAIKHSRPGGRIEVAATAIDGDIEIAQPLRVLYGAEVFREWKPDNTSTSIQGNGTQSELLAPDSAARASPPRLSAVKDRGFIASV